MSPPERINFNVDRPILSAAKCRPKFLKNIRYMRILAGVPRGGDVKCNTCYRIPRPNSMQPALDVYSMPYVLWLWSCGLWLVRQRSRDGPILSVSSVISIIVAFTGRVLWFSAIVVISRHGRENWRTLCNFSIWTVAGICLYKKDVLW